MNAIFSRLYTSVKGMLWRRRNISESFKPVPPPADNKAPPKNGEQLLFDFK